MVEAATSEPVIEGAANTETAEKTPTGQEEGEIAEEAVLRVDSLPQLSFENLLPRLKHDFAGLPEAPQFKHWYRTHDSLITLVDFLGDLHNALDTEILADQVDFFKQNV